MEEKIDINFLEIGVADFDTIIQNCGDDEIGFTVEPLKFYLDKLPNKKNVKKINAAIVGTKKNTTTKVYYVEEKDINSRGLPIFLKGCNKIGDYHPYHLKYDIKNIVKTLEIDVISVEDFLIENKIRGIGYLKIDTEGCDVDIMRGLYQYMKILPKEFHPKKITFETNSNSNEDEVKLILDMYYGLGYSLLESNLNTTIIKS